MGAATRRLTGSCGLFFRDRFRGRIGTLHLLLVTAGWSVINVEGGRNFGRFQDASRAQTVIRSWKPSRDTSEPSQVTINQIPLPSLMLFRIAALL